MASVGREGAKEQIFSIRRTKQAMERDFTMKPEQVSILCASNIRMSGVLNRSSIQLWNVEGSGGENQ